MESRPVLHVVSHDARGQRSRTGMLPRRDGAPFPLTPDRHHPARVHSFC